MKDGTARGFVEHGLTACMMAKRDASLSMFPTPERNFPWQAWPACNSSCCCSLLLGCLPACNVIWVNGDSLDVALISHGRGKDTKGKNRVELVKAFGKAAIHAAFNRGRSEIPDRCCFCRIGLALQSESKRWLSSSFLTQMLWSDK